MLVILWTICYGSGTMKHACNNEFIYSLLLESIYLSELVEFITPYRQRCGRLGTRHNLTHSYYDTCLIQKGVGLWFTKVTARTNQPTNVSPTINHIVLRGGVCNYSSYTAMRALEPCEAPMDSSCSFGHSIVGIMKRSPCIGGVGSEMGTQSNESRRTSTCHQIQHDRWPKRWKLHTFSATNT